MKDRRKPCQCGEILTLQPLSKCHPCATCGQMLHNQYQIIYHPNCVKRYELD